MSERSKLWSVSPSQITAYRRCPRVWANQTLLKDREPSKPHQLRGDAIHRAMEVYIQTGEVLPEVSLPDPLNNGELKTFATLEFVQAAQPHIPKPMTDPFWDEWKGKGPNGKNSAGVMVEQAGEMSTWVDEKTGEFGPAFVQYIDLVEAYPDRAKISDYKTTSDLRYMKKPAELHEDTQLNANAKWLFSVSDYKEIEVGHVYLHTKPKRPKAIPVFTTVTRESVEKVWARDMVLVREMTNWAKMRPDSADRLPPNTDACGDYGGCYYKSKCFGADVLTDTNGRLFNISKRPGATPGIFGTPINTEKTNMGLLDTLKARTAPAASTPTPAAAPAAPVDTVTPAASAPAAALFAPKAAPVQAPSVSPAPVIGLVVPATGTGPAPAPKGLAGLFSAKAAPAPTPTPVAPAAVIPPAPAPPAAAPPFDIAKLGVSPPDAPSPTSTPEEVAAANPPKDTKVEETAPEAPPAPVAAISAPSDTAAPAATAEAPKPRRGRPAGSKNAPKGAPTPEPATDAAPAMVSEGPAPTPDAILAPEATTPNLAAVLLAPSAPADPTASLFAPSAPDVIAQDGAPPVDAALEALRAKLSSGDTAFECPVKFIFIDCLPGKGWPVEMLPRDLYEFMHAFEATAASSANAIDYRMIRYESKGYLSSSIRVLMKGLPASVFVDSRTPGAPEFLAAVTPYAEMVFKGSH